MTKYILNRSYSGRLARQKAWKSILGLATLFQAAIAFLIAWFFLIAYYIVTGK